MLLSPGLYNKILGWLSDPWFPMFNFYTCARDQIELLQKWCKGIFFILSRTIQYMPVIILHHRMTSQLSAKKILKTNNDHHMMEFFNATKRENVFKLPVHQSFRTFHYKSRNHQSIHSRHLLWSTLKSLCECFGS